MDREKVLRKELSALLEGGHAHMNFREVLSDFPMRFINGKAPNVPYSPWQFLEHMRIAQWDILEFIRNPKHVSPDYPEGYRPRVEDTADERTWDNTVGDFTADLQSLKDMVADPGTDLFAPIPHAPEYTIFREILVAADHNSYHIGELALLRQVLNLWPEGSEYLTG